MATGPAPVPEPDPAKPANGVTTGSASICAAYGGIVEAELGRGRNAMAIWQDLVDRHGFTGA